jgi:hypothetical protein
MDEVRVQQLLKKMRDAGFGVPHELAAVQSEINFVLAQEPAAQLAQLSANISQAQTVLGTRIQDLKDSLSAAAAGSSRQAESLVRWTKWYVLATLAILGVGVRERRRDASERVGCLEAALGRYLRDAGHGERPSRQRRACCVGATILISYTFFAPGFRNIGMFLEHGTSSRRYSVRILLAFSS